MHAGLGIVLVAALVVLGWSSELNLGLTTTVAAEEIVGDCHPSYSGQCVPQASDVDCAGGSGNGPAYVTGPVQVIGSDVYELDRDGDGVACEPFRR
jgi:hypothetical protein